MSFRRLWQHIRHWLFGHGRAGVVVHKPYCYCGGTVEYSDKYDAYYCQESRVWLEKGCGEDDCHFCLERPKLAPTDSSKG